MEELKTKLAKAEAKARDFGKLLTFNHQPTNSHEDSEVLKKQADQQAAEYDRLATEYNKATGSVSDKRKD